MILNRLCYFGVIVHECEHSHVHLQQSTKTQMSSYCRPVNETFSKAMTRTIKQMRHSYTNQWPKTTMIWCVLCINNRRIDLFVWLSTNANYRTDNKKHHNASCMLLVFANTQKRWRQKAIIICMMQAKQNMYRIRSIILLNKLIQLYSTNT